MSPTSKQARPPKHNVVLVLGAGAGADFKMPLGSELQDMISNYCRVSRDADPFGNPEISDGLIEKAISTLCRGESPMPYADALRQIHDGIYLRASIDDYLDRHRSNAIVNVCGKMLIARAILSRERYSHLYFPTTNMFNTVDFNSIRGSWLIRFWQMLARDTPTEEIASSLDHITFINFNYDRCLEHFLIHAFRGLDNWEQQKAHDFVYRNVSILHPYGSVGPLNGVMFGDENADLVSRSQDIKTYTEQITNNNTIDKIKSAIQSANILIFLGFHFHRQNVELLKPISGTKVERVYATVRGISRDDQDIVMSQLKSIVRADLPARVSREYRLVDGDCTELFCRFEKTLDL